MCSRQKHAVTGSIKNVMSRANDPARSASLNSVGKARRAPAMNAPGSDPKSSRGQIPDYVRPCL